MINVTENNEESIFNSLHQGNQINEQDLNNLCYTFLELLEASLTIQYEIEKQAEQTGNMNLTLYSKGFDQIIKQCHHEYLEIKKKNNWESNIGEELQ